MLRLLDKNECSVAPLLRLAGLCVQSDEDPLPGGIHSRCYNGETSRSCPPRLLGLPFGEAEHDSKGFC